MQRVKSSKKLQFHASHSQMSHVLNTLSSETKGSVGMSDCASNLRKPVAGTGMRCQTQLDRWWRCDAVYCVAMCRHYVWLARQPAHSGLANHLANHSVHVCPHVVLFLRHGQAAPACRPAAAPDAAEGPPSCHRAHSRPLQHTAKRCERRCPPRAKRVIAVLIGLQ
jgi:hypothetical protein